MGRKRGWDSRWMGKEWAAAFCAALFLCTGSSPAWANVKQIKAYKEAFPDEKPKCIHCHAVEKPKKEDGQHDLNAYGEKVKALAAEPTVETYQAAGKS